MSTDLTYGSPDPAHPATQLAPEEIATLPLQALLVRSGMVTLEQLSDALRENIASGRPVEEIVVTRGWVAADAVARLQAAKQAFVAPPPAAHEPPAIPVAPPPAAHAPPPVPVAPPPVAPPPPPASEPAPIAAPPIVQTGSEANGSVGVFLNLADGERLWVGRFANADAGEEHAAEIIDALMRPEPGVWPRFGNRLVRPGSVVAVEVSRRRDE